MLIPYFVAEPPSDAFRPLVLDDHGASAVIIACDMSDAGMFEDACQAARDHAHTLYPIVCNIIDPRNN